MKFHSPSTSRYYYYYYFIIIIIIIIIIITITIIIIVIIIIIIITFMQDIFNFIPESKNVFGVYSVADVLWLKFMLRVMFFPHVVRFILLHQHFPQYVCSGQYGCFLWFLDFVILRYLAQVLSERFSDGSR